MIFEGRKLHFSKNEAPSSLVHTSGILITRWESTKLGKGVEKQLRDSLGKTVYQTKIRKNVSLAEAPYEAQDIVTYSPKSNGAQDYLAFTEELIESMNH